MAKSKKEGSILGGLLLIAGSCIGAGMLGLPILTGLCGFFPSLIMFFCAWAFMNATALLLVEANGWFPHSVNLLTMVSRTLGKSGKVLSWILYLFLFYALLVAYIAASGGLLSSFFKEAFSLNTADWMGSLFLVILFGWVVFLGTRQVDLWNRFMMGFKIIAFACLVILGVRYVQSDLLLRSEPKFTLFSLPILVISFGFHNMIPSLMNYMKGDVRRVRLSIFLGGLLILVIYLLWQIIVLGIVPLDGKSGILDSLKHGNQASQAISGILGLQSVSYFANFFAFFAILTSFLAQTLSLSHFLADGLNISYKKHENLTMCVLALVPPLIFALLYPEIFFTALNFAGGICAVILFGIFPVLMVWKGRYQKMISSSYKVSGGKLLLIAVFLFACLVAFFELSHLFKASYLPEIGG